jgi:hypothetical protein
LGVFCDERPHRGRVGFGPDGLLPSEDEFGVFRVGHSDLGIIDIHEAGLSFGIEGDDPPIELVRLVDGREPLVVLAGELVDRLDVLRVFGGEVRKGLERLDALGGSLELLDIGVGRRRVAGEPVDLLPGLVEDQDGRRRLESEAGEDRFSRELAAGRPVEDEGLGEEVGELGVLVNLLDQQVAAPSATLLVEVDEDELVLLFGLGHGLVERPLQK